MLRRLLLLTASLAITAVALPVAAADAFNPATQSHPGACSQETTSVTHAVHDFAENGVLSAFAGLVGIHGSTGAVMAHLDSELVLGTVSRRVVTENHGCEGVGDWFAVGPRTLNAGEHVGVRVPAKLRTRLCSHPGHGCKRVDFDAHVVFPTNCWNPNFGKVRVAVYVHKPKVVPKSYKERHLPHGLPVPLATPTPTPVPATPVVTPTPAPSATDTLECSAGGVVVTLANAASATAPASFTVDGKSYGPLAAGASETVTIPVAPGASTTLEVVSGSSVLIASRQIANTCAAQPEATIKAACVKEADGEEIAPAAEVLVHLVDAPEATLPASFIVEREGEVFNENFELELETVSEAVGPLAPGDEKTAEFVIQTFGRPTTVTVTSGGRQILKEELTIQCGETE